MSLNKPIKPILNNQVSCAIVTCMDTKLNENTGQILKLMHEALALGQKSGNDALKKSNCTPGRANPKGRTGTKD